MHRKLWVLLLVAGACVTPGCGFLWSIFGGNNCNCCRCPPFLIPLAPQHSFVAPPAPMQHYSISYAYSSPPTISSTYSQSPIAGYTAPIIALKAESYRGPPAATPLNYDQLYMEGNPKSKYTTNQVAYPSESRPMPMPMAAVEQYSETILSQLEKELAAEKYRYNMQKAQEKKEKQKQGRIRVFKITPHKLSKINKGMVEWQASQVAKYTNEKTADKFLEAKSSINRLTDNENLEEFIPIEIGSEPEYADEEPAEPPPNVRNRISHDPVLASSFHITRLTL